MTEPENRFTVTMVARQAQAIVTFGYIVMVGLGMLFYSQKYAEFGINIFQYASIFHFLVAPFEDRFIFFLSAAGIGLFAVGYGLDDFLAARFPMLYSIMYMGTNKAPWFEKYKSWSWPLTLLILMVIYSDFYAEKSYRDIVESDDITIQFADGDLATGKMIGKTETVFFLLEDSLVKALPLDSMVKEIVIGAIPIEGADERSKEAAENASPEVDAKRPEQSGPAGLAGKSPPE